MTSSDAPPVAMLKTSGKIYRIPHTPHESLAQVYERGWYIVENTRAVKISDMTPELYNMMVNASFEWIHKKQGMSYDG